MKSRRILHPTVQQPMLDFTQRDLATVCERIRLAHFPSLAETPRIRFVQRGTLANIRRAPRGQLINLHAILNSPETPTHVFRWIMSHELLHLEIRPREIRGRMVAHPPEFFERELQLVPGRAAAKRWLFQTLGERLKVRPRLECIQVLPAKRRNSLLRDAG